MVGVIYYIKQLSTSKIYIGLTTDFIRRRGEHLHELRCGKHYNQHLQKAWNKYTESDFEFGVLEEVHGTKDDLKQAEIRLIDEFNTTNGQVGFNQSRGGDMAKWRAINQYTKDGIFIRMYDTIALAAASLGKLSTPIWKALNGKVPSAHGYQWRYCDSDQDVRKGIGDHNFRGSVLQFDMQNNFVSEYPNAMEAGKAIQNITNAKSYKSVAINIRKVCYGQMKQYQNFIWKLRE